MDATFNTEVERWEAVVNNDAAADGRFFYAVASTGIYCCPSCRARTPHRVNVDFYGSASAAEAAGYRPCKRCRPSGATPSRRARDRIDGLDWPVLIQELDTQGYVQLGVVLRPEECRSLIAAYGDDDRFRSTVTMARHGFGRGEYKYFRYPLPDVVEEIRTATYPHLVGVANDWSERISLGRRYPPSFGAMLKYCRDVGQDRPTPLMLRYGPGDYNCLHQDLYGEVHFPIQLAILLDRPGRDFDGGAFMLTEQRPRMQSRGHVVPLSRGEGVLFAVNQKPVRGSRGDYRVKMRHGVSEVRVGNRHTLGVIFHDAA